MTEANLHSCSTPFTRGSKVRASLPISRTSSPTGVLYLQYGDETKQVRMPGEISSVDTLRAMFVAAFPQQLTMKDMRSPNTAIYMKDPRRNVYFDLDDIRNINSHSCLKLYHRDSAQLVSLVQSEARISKDVLYGNHSPAHTKSPSSRVSLQSLQGSMSPPMVRSMPSSPSRIAHGGRGSRAKGDAVGGTISRERLLSSKRSSGLCSSSSAILERKDVIPDEDGGRKNVARLALSERGPRHPGSLNFPQHDEGGSINVSSRCTATPSMSSHLLDNGIPGGLRQYHASVKPLLGYRDIVEQQTLSRRKNRKNGDSKTPPLSPQRVNEIQKNECQFVSRIMSPDQMSPVCSSFEQCSSGSMMEVMRGSRRNASASSTSSVFLESPVSLSAGYVEPISVQSERMKAMEERIAGLAGLVHRALSAGIDISEVKDMRSDVTGNGPPECFQAEETLSIPGSVLPSFPPCKAMQQNLASLTRNMSELRQQLQELRCLQLSNDQAVSSMLRMVGQELALTISDRLAESEGAIYGCKAKMEEERLHYQAAQERILRQLSELEEYVALMQTNITSNSCQQSISLSDVEEGAINLRHVGEELAIIKGEFPELQMKMRSVLRTELEAVRFLKEEPLKMDSMLKRVKFLTETLSFLRRSVHADTGQGPKMKCSPDSSPKPHLSSLVQTNSSSEPEPSSSCNITQRMKNLSRSESNPPTTIGGHDLPHVAKALAREAPMGIHNEDPSAVNQNVLHLEAQDHHGLICSSAREQMFSARKEASLDLTVQVSQHDQSQEQNVDQDAETLSLSDSLASTSSDLRSSREKPICSSMDKEHLQSSDEGVKCPAPPPRKLKAASVVRNEERTAKVIFVRKQEDKGKSMVALSKPPRHPPEVKPKPKRYPRALLNTASSSSDHHTKADQQVTHEPLKHFPGKKNQFNYEDRGSPSSQLTYHYCGLTEPAENMGANKSHDYGLQNLGEQKPEVKLHSTRVPILPKDNDPGKSMRPDQGLTSPKCSFHSLPSILDEEAIQDDSSQLYIKKAQSPDRAESLNSDTSNDNGPHLLPPNTINHCSSMPKENESAIFSVTASPTCLGYENPGFELNDDKTPIVVILEEPIDDVYLNSQCLSTIFECEEEHCDQKEENVFEIVEFRGNYQSHDSHADNKGQGIRDSSSKPKFHQKFRLKFPPNKLAAIRQAIRWSRKPHKKTEVACDNEEKVDSRKHGMEYKPSNTGDHKGFGNRSPVVMDVHQSSRKSVNEICQSTHESINSLEESIKQLTISVDRIAVPLHSPQNLAPPVSLNSISHYRDETFLKGLIKQDHERSLIKRPAPPNRAQTPPQSKRAKPLPAQQSGKSSKKIQTTGASTDSSFTDKNQQSLSMKHLCQEPTHLQALSPPSRDTHPS